jgi:hypothetical protein
MKTAMLRALDRFARGVCCLGAAAAAAMLLPMPTFMLWMAHFAALETSLVSAVAGYAAAAWLLARGGTRRGFWVLLALASAGVATLPSAQALLAFRDAPCAFSLAGYAGLAAADTVAVERDLHQPPRAAHFVSAPWRRGDSGAGDGPGSSPPRTPSPTAPGRPASRCALARREMSSRMLRR